MPVPHILHLGRYSGISVVTMAMKRVAIVFLMPGEWRVGRGEEVGDGIDRVGESEQRGVAIGHR